MRFYFALVFFLALMIIGCTSGTPTTPDSTPALDTGRETVSGAGNHALWGVWDISIDPETLTAEIIPVRGPQFTCNVTRLMQPPSSPIHMVKILVGGGSDPSTGYFEVEVQLTHPFPGMNQFSGFDVRGILMADGTNEGMHDPTASRSGTGDTLLLNPDGYTRWWNSTEFTSYGTIFGFTPGGLAPPAYPTATLNPYKYFAEGLDKDASVTDLDTAKRGFFPTLAGTLTRTYSIQFKMDGPSPVFDFQYAIDASWDPPDPAGAPDYLLENFPLSANCQEAFAMSVSDPDSTAWYIDSTDNGGELMLRIEVYDWQSLENPGGVPAEVSGIWVEGNILGGAVDALAGASILPGSTAVSSIFETILGPLSLTQSGPESLFCTVESEWPNSYEPQISGGNVFDYPDAPLAAYFEFKVIISDISLAVSPTVLTIDPEWGYQDDQLEDVVITGTEFDPDCTVALEITPGDELTVSNLEWIDDTTLELDINMTGATLGFYDVIVINPMATPGVLEDGFEVREFNPPTWPTTQGNRANTGHVEGLNGPSGILSSPSWSVTWGGETNLGNAMPVFLSSDTAFLSIAYNYNDSNHLPAIAVDLATQTVKWERRINETSASSVVVKGISEDGTVVLVRDWPSSWMYGLDAEDGSTLWQCELSGFAGSDSYATLDLDGNFIIAIEGTGVRSIDPSDGTVNWTASIGDPIHCTPAVGENGVIYAWGPWDNAELHALDPSDGSEKWTNNPSVGMNHNGVTVHPDGNIIVFSQTGLYCFQDNGDSYTQVWNQSMPYAWYCSPAVDPNGYIILFDGDGTLRRIDPADGTTTESTSGWGDYGTRPAIGDDGLIYTNNESYFRCFNSDLTLRWSYYTYYPLSYWSSPAIDQNGAVYSARRDHGLCAWQD